ncbi:MAG: hypothetical protein JXB38_12630 [Anaerolineales bacterium]|nr:hypothetical protein [Anaerolineales bacterium]
MTQTKIAVVGAGMMGTALCWPLADNRHAVHLAGTPLDREIIASIQANGTHPKLERQLPDGITAYQDHDLAAALEDAALIVSGVSSFGVNWFAETVGPHLRPDVPVIAVTKGLEDAPNGDLTILPAATNQRLPDNLKDHISLNAIAGPCIANELAARRQTCVVFCGQEQAAIDLLKETFTTDYYHVWTSLDVVGVEVCAALKNAYAMGVGLAVGMMETVGSDRLANMYNPQAALFAQGCLEIQRMVELLGGKNDNLFYLPAPGDLYVTVFGGRTVRLGKLLGKGLSFAEAREIMAGDTLESVEIITRVGRALPKLEARGLVDPGGFPLMKHLDQIINHGAKVDIPWEAFYFSI